MLAHGVNLLAGTDFEVELHDVKFPQTKNRITRPTKIVIDWSGNEMNAEEYANWLVKSQSGAHIFIADDGSIHQYADLWSDLVHRGQESLDKEAIWIVLQNQGKPPFDRRVERGVFEYRWNGIASSVLAVTSDQIETLLGVIALICASLSITPSIPRKNDLPVFQRLNPKTVVSWNGILLASHVAPTVSPGPGVLDALAELEDDFFSTDEDDEDDEDDEGGDLEVIDPEEFERSFPDPS